MPRKEFLEAAVNWMQLAAVHNGAAMKRWL